jgi:hypothetical protein
VLGLLRDGRMLARWDSKMDRDTDNHSAASVLSVLPYLILIGYALLIGWSYSPYLDVHLRYRAPNIPVAPEDVLGLGFGLPWATVTLVFVFSFASALAVRPKRFAFALVLLTFFCLLSITDFYLYRVLESQVIGS